MLCDHLLSIYHTHECKYKSVIPTSGRMYVYK